MPLIVNNELISQTQLNQILHGGRTVALYELRRATNLKKETVEEVRRRVIDEGLRYTPEVAAFMQRKPPHMVAITQQRGTSNEQ